VFGNIYSQLLTPVKVHKPKVNMRTWVVLSIVVAALMAFAAAEPDAPVYGAPAVSSGYGAPAASGYSSGGSGGEGWGWGWRPKVRYLNLRIPIPQLPKIRLGVHAGIKASIGHGQGWGWGK
jgi:hypothetical protein